LEKSIFETSKVLPIRCCFFRYWSCCN